MMRVVPVGKSDWNVRDESKGGVGAIPSAPLSQPDAASQYF